MVATSKINASDADTSDTLAHSVAIYGDYVIASAHQDDDGGTTSGSAYIFVRDGTSWSQQAKLTASDADEMIGLDRM